MKERESLIELCNTAMEQKGLIDQKHKDRLELEMKEIDIQVEYEYFLDLYNKKATFATNENNLFIAYLLGLTKDVNLDSPPVYVQGEFPDIDLDFLPLVRDYLKNDWAPEQFGRDKVCSIGTYGTLGIKMALKDSTRVYGLPKDEIEIITKKIEDKDDENEDLTWDKALELYPDLAEYCKKHENVASAAKTFVGRNKSGGVHAGGLIISSKPIADFVPLEVRSVTKENKYGVIVSAWTEGQNTQDLQPVGLVKFDLLVVDGLMQIARTCKLIKERYGLKNVCARPGQRDWSDTAYLNDKKALELADKADLKCIFQFNSPGIRKMVKKGGVKSFDDLAAYSALYRPGPLGMKMDEAYCLRKKGLEEYTLHPLMKPIVGKTYGVLVFQEQVMKILNAVGDIPLIQCEKIRKAISKKKIAQFAKYKEMFLVNGQKNLNSTLEDVQNLWDQIESFADYGFNKSHSYAYTFISAKQLYLKAHYPLEFYTSVFMCEDESDKIKEYKVDAEQHGIELMPVHINKSKQNFSIGDDNKIYYGFSNLKKIGDAVSERIVTGQPYASMSDFLERFGTETSVLKGLISLGVFEESEDRLTLWKFYEYYKNFHKSRKDRAKRNEDAMERYQLELRSILDSHCPNLTEEEKDQYCKFEDSVYDSWNIFSSIEIDEQYKYKSEVRIRKVNVCKMLNDVRKKRESSIRNFQTKEIAAVEEPPSINNFHSDRVKVDEELLPLLSGDTNESERTYYGFQWVHELEESPDYLGHTLEWFNHETEKSLVAPVEVKILSIMRKDFKSGKGHSFTIKAEDSNGAELFVTFWSDDYERFKEELVVGNLVRMRIKPPVGNFNYSFDAPQKHLRWKLLPKNKDEDCRIYLMKKPIPKVKQDKKIEEVTYDMELI